MKYIILNVVFSIALFGLAGIYFMQPTDGLKLNLIVKDIAGGLFISLLILQIIINIGMYLWDKYGK